MDIHSSECVMILVMVNVSACSPIMLVRCAVAAVTIVATCLVNCTEARPFEQIFVFSAGRISIVYLFNFVRYAK